MENKKTALEIFLPERTLDWFNITSWDKKENEICITLEEKNNPPITDRNKDKKIISKGFCKITITDFPIRGRRSLLTFKRRRWQVEGEKKYLKRDIKLCFPGTKLETEFADFLKEDGGRESGLAEYYRRVSKDPGEGI